MNTFFWALNAMVESNEHLISYLDYYRECQDPRFAVMINGPWGSGKTFFVKKYFDDRKHKTSPTSEMLGCLYVSLYVVNNFKQIEQSFFQQLHPILARKEVAIAAWFLKGALKTALKVDIDGVDVTINSQIPSIDLVDSMSDSAYVINF